MKRAWMIAAALVALPTPVEAGTIANPPGRFAPRDECVRLPGAAPFRAKLARAVARRDVAGFVALANPGIKLDFGGGEGRVLLRQTLTGSGSADYWRGLEQLLQLGCATERGNLTLPWFFNQDLGELDTFSVMFVTGANVPLLELGNSRARALGTLSWQLVEPVGNPTDGAKFVQVDVVGAHRRGYVEASHLRSPVDLRLIAERRSGVWQITALVAGD